MQWTLQDRLTHASEQRRLAAGLPPLDEPAVATSATPGSPTTAPTPTPATVTTSPTASAPPADRDRPAARATVIDLRDPANVLSYSPPPAAAAGPPPAAPLPRRRPSIGLPVWQGAPVPPAGSDDAH